MFRLPSFNTQVHTGLGYGIADIGRACVNRLFSCLTTLVIIGIILYLFYANPPWFQEIRHNIADFFSNR